MHCIPLLSRGILTVMLLMGYIMGKGGGWVRQRCHVSYVTGAFNWDWLTAGQGPLSLQQVRVEGECFYFFCFFIFIHFPLSPLSLSFISSTISSISLHPFSARWHKMTHMGWHVVKHQSNHCHGKRAVIAYVNSKGSGYAQSRQNLCCSLT